MFEREILDAMFIDRWNIVRTLKKQTIAEHSWVVAMYANDICHYLEVPVQAHLAVLQYALWHDSKDEIFSGDMPGPNKRGLLLAAGPDAKKRWNMQLADWANKVFSFLHNRSGGHIANGPTSGLVHAIVKCADWLEAATRMATESQLGNACTVRHIDPNMNGAIESARELCSLYYRGDTPGSVGAALKTGEELTRKIIKAVEDAYRGQSRGPWITGEDDTRRAEESPA